MTTDLDKVLAECVTAIQACAVARLAAERMNDSDAPIEQKMTYWNAWHALRTVAVDCQSKYERQYCDLQTEKAS